MFIELVSWLAGGAEAVISPNRRDYDIAAPMPTGTADPLIAPPTCSTPWGLMRLIRLVVCLGFLVACGPMVKRPMAVAPAVPSLLVSATQAFAVQLVVVSDTHNSNPMSPHSTWSGSELSDDLVARVAIRPAQMDAWALKLLGWVLDNNAQRPMLLHLGDASNLGCRRELAQFLKLMKTARPGRWYMAPGNHDSLAYGNWAGIGGSASNHRDWAGDCSNAGREWSDPRLRGLESKVQLIDDYVAAQGWEASMRDATTDFDRKAHNRCEELIASNGALPADALRVRACRNQAGEYSDPNPPAYISYLLQQIPIPETNVDVILVDTTQFIEFPRPGHTGGQQGGVRNDQVAILKTWLEDISAAHKLAILAGHFPIDMLDKQSKAYLQQVIETYPIIAYLSGHTHDPTNFRIHRYGSHQTRITPQVGFSEINVGSLLDWPMTYATLGIPAEASVHRMYVAIHNVPSELGRACEAKFRHDAAYASYRAHPSLAGKVAAAIWGSANQAYALQRATMYHDMVHDLQLTSSPTFAG